MQDQPFDVHFKIVLTGDSGVGKTSLLLRYVENKFLEKLQPEEEGTIDCKIIYKELDGVKYKLTICDTAGQEKFRALTATYYRGADGIMIVYDQSKRVSFQNIGSWIDEINRITKKGSRILVSTKSDTEPIVNSIEAIELATNLNMPLIFTSSKMGTNVPEAFELLLQQMIKERTPVQPIIKQEKKKPKCLLI